MTDVATEIVGTLASLLHDPEPPLAVRAWDGSSAGPPTAPTTLVFRSRQALHRILWRPNELGLARAYVSGEIDLEGDVFALVKLRDRMGGGGEAPLTTRSKLHLGRSVLKLAGLHRNPAPPKEEARVSGRLHSKSRDAEAISHHYDVGNDFYRLVLGESMTYSCAYWTDGGTLADAQAAKHDLVCRKLALAPGMRVLDVGCGWGAFLIHAAKRYGVHGVGVTLSHEQATYARKRVADEGVADLIEIRVQDYRDVTDGPFDAISSVGMAEHVGLAHLPAYTAKLYALLRPGGRLLNHAISRRPGKAEALEGFMGRYVFPDGELQPIGTMTSAIEEAGFEVRDVQALREHYGLTLRAWVDNLQANWAEAVALTSEGRARVWLLYMAGSAVGFETNRLGVTQVLAVKPADGGASAMPLQRAL
ncbi:MAG: cyclopropane-fatty-acyl-phospholipid synthase [Frankiaceae bacterium]|jgi:cyclopropane-fatty-acyl-phospholipid synthase|nr:cyclopropane-fatty-acyl-phospholipid synthase [Frankiaceae bacterium]